MNPEQDNRDITISLPERIRIGYAYIVEKAKHIGQLIVREDIEEPGSRPHPNAEKPQGE